MSVAITICMEKICNKRTTAPVVALLVSPCALHRDYTVPLSTMFRYYPMVIAKSWTMINLLSHLANKGWYAQQDLLTASQDQSSRCGNKYVTANIWSGKIPCFWPFRQCLLVSLLLCDLTPSLPSKTDCCTVRGSCNLISSPSQVHLAIHRIHSYL